MADKVPSAAGSGPMLIKPATWEAIRKALADIDIRPDPLDFEISRRGGQLFFRLKHRVPEPQSGGGGATAATFSISLSKKPESEGGGWEVRVSPGILRRLDNTELVEVAGTYDPEDEDTAHAVEAGDYVWIEINIKDGVPGVDEEEEEEVPVEIKVGAEWPGHPKLAQYTAIAPYSQEKSIILLGKIIEDAASEATPKPLIVTDAVPGNRMLVQGVVNGKLAWVGINA